MKFGWGSGFPQGGMNEHGLFWDATARPYVAMPLVEANKTRLETPVMQKVIEQCKSVVEARAIFDRYYCEDQYKAQYLVGGASGHSLIIEGDTILEKKDNYQVLTNFYQSNPELGGYPCWRYDTATDLLGDMNELNLYLIGEVLASTHQEGKYPTQYSNIYDLKNRIIYLFHFHNYNEFIKIRLQEELNKGEKSYQIPELFSCINNLSADVIKNGTNVSVNFSWEGKTESTYELHFSKDPGFSDSTSVLFLTNQQHQICYGVIFLLGFVLLLSLPRKVKNKLVLAICLFAIAGISCNKEEETESEKTQLFHKTVDGFGAGHIYYWKLKARADLNSGFFSETPVLSFLVN